MPCFMATSPSGVQIYLCTSLLFTLFQSVIIRNETFRTSVNLPSRENMPSASPELAIGFNRLKLLEQEAAKLRGPNQPIVGKDGVLAPGWTTSFIGRRRRSTIDISNSILPSTDYTSTGLFGTQLKNPSLVVMDVLNTSNDISDTTALTPLQSNVVQPNEMKTMIKKEKKSNHEKLNLSWKGKKNKKKLASLRRQNKKKK